MKLGFIYRLLELQNFLKDIETANEACQLEERLVGSRTEEEGTLKELLTSVQLR